MAMPMAILATIISKLTLNLPMISSDEANKISLFDNPLFWSTAISILINICLFFVTVGMYRTNKRTFSILYEKPTIDVPEIDTEAKNYGTELKPEIMCKIKIQIKNSSSYGNIVSLDLKKSNRSQSLNRLESYSIPGNSIDYVHMKPKYEDVKKCIGKKMLLIGRDLKNNELRKKFPFKKKSG